jgi:hypothetical protein
MHDPCQVGPRFAEGARDPIRTGRLKEGPGLFGVFPPAPPPDDDLHSGVLVPKTAAEVAGLGQPARPDRGDQDGGRGRVRVGPTRGVRGQNAANLYPCPGLPHQGAQHGQGHLVRPVGRRVLARELQRVYEWLASVEGRQAAMTAVTPMCACER